MFLILDKIKNVQKYYQIKEEFFLELSHIVNHVHF